MVVEASSTLLLRFITMELLSRCEVEFFRVVVVNDLFFSTMIMWEIKQT